MCVRVLWARGGRRGSRGFYLSGTPRGETSIHVEKHEDRCLRVANGAKLKGDATIKRGDGGIYCRGPYNRAHTPRGRERIKGHAAARFSGVYRVSSRVYGNLRLIRGVALDGESRGCTAVAQGFSRRERITSSGIALARAGIDFAELARERKEARATSGHPTCTLSFAFSPGADASLLSLCRAARPFDVAEFSACRFRRSCFRRNFRAKRTRLPQ